MDDWRDLSRRALVVGAVMTPIGSILYFLFLGALLGAGLTHYLITKPEISASKTDKVIEACIKLDGKFMASKLHQVCMIEHDNTQYLTPEELVQP